MTVRDHMPDDDRTGTEVEEDTSVDTRLSGGWNVVVWDDPVNLMGYVVYVFQKLFGFSVEKATEHMLEVHEEGRSLVATAPREKSELWVVQLHAYGLQATLERADI